MHILIVVFYSMQFVSVIKTQDFLFGVHIIKLLKNNEETSYHDLFFRYVYYGGMHIVNIIFQEKNKIDVVGLPQRKIRQKNIFMMKFFMEMRFKDKKSKNFLIAIKNYINTEHHI